MLVASFMLLWGCPEWRPEKWTFWGQVIDAQTYAPIQGAVIAIIWYRRPGFAMDGPRYLEEVGEGVTDASGHFRFESVRPPNWNPLRYRHKDPVIIVYALGYKPLVPVTAHSFGFDTWEAELHALQGGVLHLTKLITRDEWKKFASLGELGVDDRVPMDRLPRLLIAVNLQAAAVGLPPYHRPGGSAEGGR